MFKQNARKGLNVDMSSVERVEKTTGLALPFVDDFSWQKGTNDAEISKEVSTLSNDKYNAGEKVYAFNREVIRIGSSKQIGYISTCALDLSKDFYVEVEAKAYNVDDNAHISISVDKGTTLTAEEALTNDYGTYCFNLSAATASSSIKIFTNTKRAIITSVKIAEGKSTYVPAPKLNISPEFAKVASNSTKATFAVTSNTKWTASTTSDWAKISTPSGENNGQVEITFSENTADTERTADIVVTTEDGSITKTFKLTQNGVGGAASKTALFGNEWNKLFGTSYNGAFNPKADKLTLNGTVEEVSIEVKNGSSTNGYIKTRDFRAYNGYTITFTAPEGRTIKSIASSKGGKSFSEGITADSGELKISNNAISWTGDSKTVKLTISKTVSFATITVTL